MPYHRFHYFLLFATSALLVTCDADRPGTPTATDRSDTSLFTLLDPSTTGIDFVNQLTEGPNTNIFVYEYFYNGGGVGAGDLNGDGKTDLYFTANMTDNRLYLNEGDFRFRDVTAASGTAGRSGPWQTGVSLADVNADGKLDVYLSYSGMLPPDKRRNQLFINQGNDENGIPQFRDEAAAYGLDSPAFSNQAYFFDYDQDGDLDALLLNHNPKSLPILNLPQTRELLATPDPERGLRLYRQDNGRFADVTEAAGINGSALSYGLGLAISDLDRDGDPDFYVSNDYEVPDYLYYNNGDGTFTDRLGEQLGQTSHFSMGSDAADVNNDGWVDLYTLDMLPPGNRRRKLLTADDNRSKMDLNLASGFHYQSMRNMLHLNRGDGTFAEVGQLAGINATDWSWSALFADFDLDGLQDLHVTNGYLRDYTDQDFIKYMNDFVAARGRLQRTDLRELIENMPASDVSNHIFANQGGNTFSDRTDSWGLQRPSNSNGAAYADLDQDGDLDLIVNNLNQPAFIYRNEAANQKEDHFLQVALTGTNAIGARVTVYAGEKRFVRELFPNRGYVSSVEPILHFGLGGVESIDRLVVSWPDGEIREWRDIRSDQRLTIAPGEGAQGEEEQVSPTAILSPVTPPIELTAPRTTVRDFDRQLLLPKQYSHTASLLLRTDANQDGKADILGSGAQGLVLFTQTGGNRFEPRTLSSSPDKNTISDLAAADINGDELPDFYVARGGYHLYDSEDESFQDEILINDGAGNYRSTIVPLAAEPTGCVAIAPSSATIFVGGGILPGRYPLVTKSRLLSVSEDGTISIAHTFPEPFDALGPVTDAQWSDLDQDGQEELIIVGEYRPIQVFSWNGEAAEDISANFFDNSPRGWWNTIEVADLNNDGFSDLVIGNQGLNNIFQATNEAPVELYATDLDENGSIDPLLTYVVDGERQLDATRDELLGQLSGLRSRFTSYKSYAEANFATAIPNWPEDTRVLRANELRTQVFMGGPGGKFSPINLPMEAQFAPVHTVSILDVNGDGTPDILLGGNESLAKQRFGKSDAISGCLLLGEGDGNFVYLPQRESGLKLKGDVRAAISLENILLFSAKGRGQMAYRVLREESMIE